MAAEECGFDANFVTDVPDYLKCSVCQFILRNPVQLMKCGHRYCETCFKSMKRYAEHHNAQLRCSIDREDIDLSNVFQDTGIARVIGNLEVKCGNIENGCAWSGDLRGLREHEAQCKYGLINTNIQNNSAQQRELSALNEVIARISKIEESAMEKEKDLRHLQFNLSELKKQFNEREEEIELFKVTNTNLVSEVKLLKDQNQEFKKLLERENERIKYLESKNELKKGFNEKEAEMEFVKLTNTCLTSDVKLLKDESQEHKKLLERENERLKFLESKINTVCCFRKKYIFIFIFISIFVSIHPWNYNSDEVKQAKLDDIRNQVATVDNKVGEIARNFNSLNTTTKLDDIRYQVATVENLLLHGTVSKPKNVTVQWKLHRYQHYYDIGEAFSPVYHTQVKGHSFKLHVRWSGAEKENFDLYFVLLRETGYKGEQEPFTLTTKLEVVDEKGKTFSGTFSKEPSFWVRSASWGYKPFLTTNHLRNYIVNDVVTIRCVLTQTAF